jgi:Fe2+ or Zn2+ uptake regulation protein
MNNDISRCIQDLFAKRGLRCTKQRLALYEALVSSDLHPTANELYQQVYEGMPSLSLATVYNTLEAFCRAGLAQKLPGTNGSARYDASMENHLYLRCEKTGRVADVPDDLSQKLLAHIPDKTLSEIEGILGFKINQVQIELVGQYERSLAAN